MTLRRQVVYLRGLHLADDADERRRVGHVGPMQVHQPVFLHVAHPLVQIQVLDAPRIERRTAAQQSVHFIPFVNEELGQITAVLSGDTGD